MGFARALASFLCFLVYFSASTYYFLDYILHEEHPGQAKESMTSKANSSSSDSSKDVLTYVLGEKVFPYIVIKIPPFPFCAFARIMRSSATDNSL